MENFPNQKTLITVLVILLIVCVAALSFMYGQSRSTQVTSTEVASTIPADTASGGGSQSDTVIPNQNGNGDSNTTTTPTPNLNNNTDGPAAAAPTPSNQQTVVPPKANPVPAPTPSPVPTPKPTSCPNGGTLCITLTSPNGGETFQSGTNVNMSWTEKAINPTHTAINIDLVKNVNGSYETIFSYPASGGQTSISFPIPAGLNTGSAYYMRISIEEEIGDAVNDANDYSDAPFTIEENPSAPACTTPTVSASISPLDANSNKTVSAGQAVLGIYTFTAGGGDACFIKMKDAEFGVRAMSSDAVLDVTDIHTAQGFADDSNSYLYGTDDPNSGHSSTKTYFVLGDVGPSAKGSFQSYLTSVTAVDVNNDPVTSINGLGIGAAQLTIQGSSGTGGTITGTGVTQ